MASPLLTDVALSRRLERTEALANARFVEARARLAPGSGAQWIEIAGAYAMYDSPHSPCTQTFGLGLFQIPSEADMDTLEAFFEDRGAPVFHEISPLADKALLPLLSERGYHPVELSNVMFLPLAGRVSPEAVPAAASQEPLRVRVAGDDDRELWERTAAEGWRELVEFADLIAGLSKVFAAAENNVSFLVDLNGQPIAAGSLAIHHKVALLAGASTIPEWRRRGAQRLLLESRLQYAAGVGCDLAMFCAEPGSGSQRNAERAGFRVAYTRIKWGLTA